jgi:hypothetical protein
MSRISRREFARSVGVAAGAALLPRSARGDEKPKPGAPPPQQPTKLSPAGQAEAEARVQMIVAKYGARLSPAERADLARLSHDAQEQLEKLRAFPLDITDEPAHVFRAPRKRR